MKEMHKLLKYVTMLCSLIVAYMQFVIKPMKLKEVLRV